MPLKKKYKTAKSQERLNFIYIDLRSGFNKQAWKMSSVWVFRLLINYKQLIYLSTYLSPLQVLEQMHGGKSDEEEFWIQDEKYC